MAQTPTPITVAYGDGIGPEIMAATLQVLEAAGAALEIETIEIGRAVYEAGHSAGIKPEAWDSLRRTRVFLKAPITTPQGGGFKSLNVTVRKTLGLYANIRPCVAYPPYVETMHPNMNLVVVRENEEDLYAGIEHRQTDDAVQCIKLITRPGTERIMRYAFEYARAYGRKHVTCMSKDNIMKLTDGLFHRTFDEVGTEYPEIQKDHMIIDIGMAKVATQPEQFDVIVLPNLYGDILSDVTAEVAGSVGLAPSANIGSDFAMFEAIHGTAPDIAGKDLANPSGLLIAGVMMLVHLGQAEVAAKIHNAWLRTIEDGVHTGDIAGPHTTEKVGTKGFADAVCARLGQLPQKFAVVEYRAEKPLEIKVTPTVPKTRKLVGIDVFVRFVGSADELAAKMQTVDTGPFTLQVITSRGVKVWPDGMKETFTIDHWRCRMMADSDIELADIVALLGSIAMSGVEFIKTEHLVTFDGEPGFTLAQGQ
jgi:isocitrate dehydrogenase